METLTQPQVLCPSCSNPMSFRNDSWQCLACHPVPSDVPICKTQKCGRPLTKLGPPWNCWICLNCNDHPEIVNKRMQKTELPDRKYLDVKMTEEKVKEIIGKQLTAQEVRNIVADTMAEYMLKDKPDPDYPPSRTEIESTAAPILKPQKPETWREKAQRLGVSLHKEPAGTGMRKKEDVIHDIEKIEESSQEDANAHP